MGRVFARNATNAIWSLDHSGISSLATKSVFRYEHLLIEVDNTQLCYLISKFQDLDRTFLDHIIPQINRISSSACYNNLTNLYRNSKMHKTTKLKHVLVEQVSKRFLSNTVPFPPP
jgi:hypothetical protein